MAVRYNSQFRYNTNRVTYNGTTLIKIGRIIASFSIDLQDIIGELDGTLNDRLIVLLSLQGRYNAEGILRNILETTGVIENKIASISA